MMLMVAQVAALTAAGRCWVQRRGPRGEMGSSATAAGVGVVVQGSMVFLNHWQML
jgi:hypothetical protein